MQSTLASLRNRITRSLVRSKQSPAASAAGNSEQVSYEKYWQVARGSYSERFVDQVCRTFEFDSVLDGGSGDGTAVRRFLQNGKQALGIEFSNEAIDQHCTDLVEAGHIRQGSLTDLPFADEQFDLVFSSEVLEHIEESDAPKAVSELARVANKHIFLTISLRPSSDNNKYHVNLKSRQWWEAMFADVGCIKRSDIVDQFQIRQPGLSVREIMQAGPTAAIMSEIDWFIENPPYDLGGELEPWFFVFSKEK